MRIRIRNVMGLEEVSLALRPGVTLAAGMNGAGKTTLLQCVAAAALGDWKMRGRRLKGETEALVRRGQANASILLEHLDSSIRVTFPDAKVERKGPAIEFGTALGMGVVKFMALDAEQRGREVAERFDTKPTREDFDNWWRTHKAAGIDPDAKPDNPLRQSVEVLWSDIGVSGWDAIAKRIEVANRNLTGQWKEATGANWGDRLRLTWAPDGLHRDEEYPLEPAVGAAREAQAQVETLLRKEAVAAGDRERAEAEAGEMPAAEQRQAELAGKIAASDAEIERTLAEMEEVGEPVDPRQHPTCPECFKTVQIVRSPGVGLTLEKLSKKALSVTAFEDAQKVRGALKSTLDRLREERQQLDRDAVLVEVDLQKAQRAKAQLARFEHLPEADPEALVAARRAAEQAVARVTAIRKLDRARDINAEWERGQAILAGLLQSGIRALVLQRKLAEINAALAKLSKAGGMHEVGITVDCELTYDGRPYSLLSESEQWRCDLVMALLMAQRERAMLLLVDRLDILHPQAREGVVRLLAEEGGHVLVTMTARLMDPRYVLDLDTHKLGHACWLGGGVLVED
jgi:energy-coupling factor transporter ATP-binding protein EcfA2